MHDIVGRHEAPWKPVSPITGLHAFDTLNGLRGLAALIVLVWHFTPLEGERYWSAYLAVDLFFLLSGVVVAHAYERRLLQGWGFRRFMQARIIRLWPLYLLGTGFGAAVIVATMLLDGAPRWQFKPLALDILQSALLVPRFGHADAAFAFDPPAWSLFCEVLVNIGYGIVGYRLGSRSVFCIALLSLSVMILGTWRYGGVEFGLNLGALVPHLWVGVARAGWGFSIGVLIYRAWRHGRLPRVAVPPMVLSMLFMVMLFVVPARGMHTGVAAIVAACAILPVLVLAAVQVEPSGWERRIGRSTADLSYPIYVTHAPFYMAASIVAARTTISPLQAYGAAMGLALVAAPFVDRLVDRPIRGYLGRLSSR